MSKGFGGSSGDERTNRRLADGVRKLSGLAKILRKYPDDPKGRKKMLKAWKRYYNGTLGEIERLDNPDIDNLQAAVEELETVNPEMPTEPIEIDQEPTPEQVEAIRDAIGK